MSRTGESARQRAEQHEYERQRARALSGFLKGHIELAETVQTNESRKKLAQKGIVPLKLGEFQNRFPTESERVARQKEIDEAEAAAVPEGLGHGLKSVWFGAGSVKMTAERARAEQELAKVMNLSPAGGVPQALTDRINRTIAETGDSPKTFNSRLTAALETSGVDPRSSVMGANGEAVKPDMAKQLALEAEQVKLAQNLYDLTQKRQETLLSELATMQEQIRASREKVAAAQEGVRVAQEQIDARKAGYAISMTTADQQIAAGTLNELKAGKSVGRDKLMLLKQHGLDTGRIGAAINAQLAKDLDPKFAAALKQWGSDEELQKRQKELSDATAELKERFEEFGRTLKENLANVFVLGVAGAAGGKNDEAGRTNSRSRRRLPGSERVASAEKAIKEEGNGFVKALDEMEKATVDAIRAAAAKGSQSAQRIKEAQR